MATATDTADTIETALGLLGAGGDRWIQGRAAQLDASRGGFDYCVIGALIAAAPTYGDYRAAYEAVKGTVGGNVARWNNETTFADVQVTLREARLRVLGG